MALLETVHLSHLPQSTPFHVALYRDIKNASFLREQLISGNIDFQYAFIDATVILSRQHIFAAVFRAVHDYLNGRLRSHNVHSEIVFSLNPTNNITESFRRFGITDATKDLLVVKVSTTPEITHDSVAEHLAQYVEGTLAPFNDETLGSISDLAKIRKTYKIPQPPAKSVDNKAVSSHIQKELEAPIIGAIALRGAT